MTERSAGTQGRHHRWGERHRRRLRPRASPRQARDVVIADRRRRGRLGARRAELGGEAWEVDLRDTAALAVARAATPTSW